MSINQLNNGDSGLTARTIINQTVTSVNSILGPNPVAAITSSFPWSASRASGINSGIVASYYRTDLTAGDGAVAHGRHNSASGQHSHAEGSGSIALGTGSHAEGYSTVASGSYSHAEGEGTQASGSFSHAEGSLTIAIGPRSHAEGEWTYASGFSSHAEGRYTSASAWGSHAEGLFTIASGDSSHAEGSQTQAIGYASHAEGLGTQAIGNYSHAEGSLNAVGAYAWFSTSINNGVVSLFSVYGDISSAINTYILQSNTLIIYGDGTGPNLPPPFHEYPVAIIESSSFDGLNTQIYIDNTYLVGGSIWVGILGIAQPISASNAFLFGSSSHAEGYNNFVVGDYSHAEGNTTSTIGSWAHTEGRLTIAKSDGAHAEGYATTASGQYDHTEGIGSSTEITKAYEASITNNVVYLNTKYGDIVSHFTGSKGERPWLYVYDKPFNNSLPYALGRYIFPISSSYYSASITVVNLDSSWIQQNINTNVNTPYCYVGCLEDSTYTLDGEILNWTGDKTIPGNHSHAEGDTSRAFGEQSHAEGYYSIATWTWAHAEGHQNRANGICSHAEGSQTQTGPMAHGAHSEGYKTIAYGNESHAEGSGSISYGPRSHAEGFQTQTGGLRGFAPLELNFNTNTIDLSGYGNITSSFPPGGLIVSDNSLNLLGSQAVLQVSQSIFDGVNTTITFTVIGGSPSGAYFSNIVIAPISSSTAGNYLLSEIIDTGNPLATAYNGLFAHSEGYNTRAIGESSHAEGYQTTAIGVYSHAEGHQTIAIGRESHAEGYLTKALGYGGHAEGANTQAIGDYSHAEGANTQAIGTYSHAEGISTVALEYVSHAEGVGTITSASFQHATGRWNLQNNTDDYFVIGDGINAGNRSNAFGVNDVRMYASNSIFFPDLTQSPEPNVLVYNSASGQVFFTASSAIGGGGGGSTSPGGTNHDVQFNDNGVFGGEQYFRYFPESRSVSIGDSSGGPTIIPQGTNNLSVGYSNIISASNAAAFGNQSKVYANNSIAFGGFENTTYSGNSLVGGYQSYISGSSEGSFAFGYKNIISGSPYSFALGNQNKNLGPGNSLAGGALSIITGSNSGFVWGNSCLVSGDGGNNSVATAMGLNATASGGYGAFAAGYNIVAAGLSQTVVGKNNIQNNTTDLFVVGNGTNTNTRSDAFKVHATGYVVMPYVSASCNFADDTAAQAGGVPLGGIYHTNGALKIRLV